MSAKLIPCDGCGRHVMSVEASCPFCGGAIDPHKAVPGRADRRMNRAAMWAFGAAVAASAATGCGDSHSPDGGMGEPDAATVTDAGEVDSGNIAQPYGAPFDAGPPDAGPPDTGPPDPDAGIAPPYGAPIDSGPDPDGGFAPLYGGAPED